MFKNVAREVIKYASEQMKDPDIQLCLQKELIQPCVDLLMRWILDRIRAYFVHGVIILVLWTLMISTLVFWWSLWF